MAFIKGTTREQKKGIVWGSASPLFYSIDAVLNILIFALVFNVGYRSHLSIWQTITYSFATSFIKDFALFIFMEFKTGGKVLKTFMHLYKTKRRAFIWTLFGSLSGGPLGFTFTTATILYSGAAYGSALANFSPIIVMLFSIRFFKTKLNWKGWVGIVLAILGFLGLSFYSSAISGTSFEFNTKVFIGVILAIVAVLTWAVETIIAEFTEKFGEEQSLNSEEKLVIKSTISSSSTLIFFIPVSWGIAYLANGGGVVTDMMSAILTSWEGWLILIAIGILITLGRVSYWYAISKAGGGRADILYYLSVLVTPILTVVLSQLSVIGFSDPLGIDKWAYWLLLSIQIIGVVLITLNTLNNKEHIYKKH